MRTPSRRTAATAVEKYDRVPGSRGGCRISRACLPRRNASAWACIVLRCSAPSISGVVVGYMSASLDEGGRGGVLVESGHVVGVVTPLGRDEPGEGRRRGPRA